MANPDIAYSEKYRQYENITRQVRSQSQLELFVQVIDNSTVM